MLTTTTLFNKQTESTESKDSKDNKEIKSANKIKIRLYLDFDGTLTGCNGKESIESEAYFKLFDSKERRTFKTADQMKQVLTEEFDKKENSKMRMTPGSIKFLKEMLTLEAKVNITSNNRKEYIKAVLAHEGLDAKEIEKINIYDNYSLFYSDGPSNENMCPKANQIYDCESKETKADVVVVCDDSRDECADMQRAIQYFSKNYCKLIVKNNETGKFEWESIEKEILTEAKPPEGVRLKTS